MFKTQLARKQKLEVCVCVRARVCVRACALFMYSLAGVLLSCP